MVHSHFYKDLWFYYTPNDEFCQPMGEQINLNVEFVRHFVLGGGPSRLGALRFPIDAVEVAHRLKAAGEGNVNDRKPIVSVGQQPSGVLDAVFVDQLLEVLVETAVEAAGKVMRLVSQGFRHSGEGDVFRVMIGDKR